MLLLFISCFFNNVFTMPLDIENARLNLALVVPTGAPVIFANDVIEMLPLVADKTIKYLSKEAISKEAIYLLSLLLILFP